MTTGFDVWRSTLPSTIEREFTFHAANEVTGPVHDHLRTMFRMTAHRLNELLPESEPKKEALRGLRAAMWAANAAVACYGSTDPGWQKGVREWLALPPEPVDDRLADQVIAEADGGNPRRCECGWPVDLNGEHEPPVPAALLNKDVADPPAVGVARVPDADRRRPLELIRPYVPEEEGA